MKLYSDVHRLTWTNIQDIKKSYLRWTTRAKK